MIACNRPHCDGTVGESGYCDVCLEPPLQPGGTETGDGHGGQMPGLTQTASDQLGREAAPGAPTGAAAGATAQAPGRGPVSGTAQAAAGPWWGLGLVTLPDVAAADPDKALQTDLSVPISRRNCGGCGAEIGRSHHGQPALTEGRCHRCRVPYSFVPKLRRGELVGGGRYEISGCIGYGGVGWVYLARDTSLGHQPVVLKGLIDPQRRTTVEAAVRELEFLIDVDHSNIVRVRDFARHAATGTDEPGGERYIVMEYVAGHTIEQEACRTPGMPAEHVIAYCLYLLAALDHLHGRGWLHCDIKPSNIMLAGTGVKLIDLGAGCRVGTGPEHRWGTEGFRAPEIGQTGPTVRSDLFAAGRTLETLFHWSVDNPPAAGPAAESLGKVIDRATASQPAARFGSAAEMAGQLSGVLREFVSLRTGEPRTAPSLLFGPETSLIDDGLGSVPPLSWWLAEEMFHAAAGGRGRPLPPCLPAPGAAAAMLPVPRPDPADPAAGLLLTFGGADPDAVLEQLSAAGQDSAEAHLLRCRGELRRRRVPAARHSLERARSAGPADGWRVRWHRGLIELAEGRVRNAQREFDTAHRGLPGEVVPRLALALCAEYLGELRNAVDHYQAVWRIDRAYASAAFGLSRARFRLGDRRGAMTTADEVPDSSRHQAAAGIAAFRVLVGWSRLSDLPAETDLGEAGRRLARPPLAEGDLSGDQRDRLTALLLEARLQLAYRARTAAMDGSRSAAASGGAATGELRSRLERCYRALAQHAASQQQHTVLIDLANLVRPRTLD